MPRGRRAMGRVSLRVVVLIAVGLRPARMQRTFGGDADSPGRMFDVSMTGSDAADGLSMATAWRTLAKVNSASFVP
jgi:hypothetical protein